MARNPRSLLFQVDPTTGTVVSGGDDSVLCAWNITATGLELVGTAKDTHDTGIRALAVDPATGTVVTERACAYSYFR